MGVRAEDTARIVRPGVKVVLGRGRSDGVCRPDRVNDAWDEARDRYEDATEAGLDGPDVGGDSFDAKTNTPHSGEHEKYGTLGIVSQAFYL